MSRLEQALAAILVALVVLVVWLNVAPHVNAAHIAVPTTPRERMAASLRAKFAAIRDVHPPLFSPNAWTAPQNELDRGLAALPLTPTPHDAFVALAPAVALIGDGHTNVSPYTDDYRTYRKHGRAFPFDLDEERGTPVVIADFAHNHLPIGTVLESVNGVPAKTLMRRLGRFVAADTEAGRAYSVCNNFRALLWQAGMGPPYRLRVRNDGLDRTLISPGITSDDIHRWDKTDASIPLNPHALRFFDGNHVAVITLRDFDGDTQTAWITHAFHTISVHRPRALIIDIRNNSGGTTAVGDALLAHTTRHTFSQLSLRVTQVSDTIKKSYGKKKFIDIYGHDAWKAPAGTVLSAQFAPQTPAPTTSDRYQGRVFVLIGDGTYSSAAMFAAGFQDSKIGDVLGTPSGGDASLFGEIYDLPEQNDDISVTTATAMFIRPNPNRPHNVHPNITLAPTPEFGADQELHAAIAYADRNSTHP